MRNQCLVDVSVRIPKSLKERLHHKAQTQFASEAAILRKMMDDYLPQVPHKPATASREG